MLVDPYCMRTEDALAGGPDATRSWRGPRFRLPRPTGIRNGGLLLVLVAVAAVMALADRPGEPDQERRLPGILQYLPPSLGITAVPPATAPTPAGAAGPATQLDGDQPAGPTARAHPRRVHPRPSRLGSSSGRRAEAASRTDDGGSSGTAGPGSGGSGPVSLPPGSVASGDGAPAVRVQAPPAAVRVTPPRVLGRDLPAVEAQTPGMTVKVPGPAVPEPIVG